MKRARLAPVLPPYQLVPRQVSSAKRRKASVEAPERKAKAAAMDSDPFHLEELPSELLLMVIEYAPEVVLAMRQTSRKLRSHVDQFVVEQATVPLVDNVRISGPITFIALPSLKPGRLSISFEIAARKSNLFYLHLLLREYLDFKREIRKMEGDDERLVECWNMFEVSLDLDDEATVRKHVACLRQWWGGRIDTVSLADCYDDMRLEFITRLLEGKKFTLLCITMTSESLTENLIKHALRAMETNGVEQLRLFGPLTCSADPVIFLPQLASKVRSIHINQCPFFSEHDPTVNHFLGANDLDWAELILDLFSNDKKLDKLCIVNAWYPNYLSKAGAERLIDELPRINKRIWFTATCDKFEDVTNLNQEYVLRVNNANRSPADPYKRCNQFLEIKHSTRVDEPSMMPMDLCGI